MTRIYYATFIWLILLHFSSCTQDKKFTKENLITIDVSTLPEEEHVVNISEFVSDIKYLPLETNKEYVIDKYASFYLFDSIIVCCSMRQILLFNSVDGSFLRSVGKYGKGANEFIRVKKPYLKNDELIIDAYSWQYPLMELSLDGTIQNKLMLNYDIDDINWLKENLYACSYHKNSNSDSLRLQIFNNEDKKIISSFFDYREFKDDPRKNTYYMLNTYYFNNDLFIKETLNDTVFLVTTEKLKPAIVFNSGKYSPPFYEKDFIKLEDYFYIDRIIESCNFIFFRINIDGKTYSCCFDKRTKKLKFPYKNSLMYNGFNNDIDGFMPFHPLTISKDNQLIGVMEAYEIKKWFAENPGKAARLSPHLKKLEDLKETDNPVVMIAKLKE